SFVSITLPPPRSTLFPYTTLFRSGATEAIVCWEAISEGQAPRDLDPEIWDESLASRSLCGPERVDVALSNSFAFGGSNVTVALGDRKSTRLNSSHVKISYAVFCLK